MKKLIASATLFAASTMLASAASVAYTFNLTNTIDNATNISAKGCGNGGNTSCDDAVHWSLDGGNAKVVVSTSAGKLWDTVQNSSNEYNGISVIASNSYAQTMFTYAGISTEDISKITNGTNNGAQVDTTTFGVSGLIANTTYTVTMLITPKQGSAAISWTTGTFVSGSYAYGNSAQQTISGTDTTTLVLSSMSVVELKLTTDSSGAFNINLLNGSASNSSGKTSIGFFAITGDVIPEPSAFGLFAGVGALALAVSRRRRK